MDFSYTGLSDHGLWLLLDCLTQFEAINEGHFGSLMPEVQAAYIKLTQNRTPKAHGPSETCQNVQKLPKTF